MIYNEHTKLGEIITYAPTRDVIYSHIAELNQSVYLPFIKKLTLYELKESNYGEDLLKESYTKIVQDLAKVKVELEMDFSSAMAINNSYEDDTIKISSAPIFYPATCEKWSCFEIEIEGPHHGNPFLEVELKALFLQNNQSIQVTGFYDGLGKYKIRFLPSTLGLWHFSISSNARSMEKLTGSFLVMESSNNNNGVVRVVNTYHFAYDSGQRYIPVGTTCYAWNHQPISLQKDTLESLKHSAFNKIRMCVFPKSYQYNGNEPELYPYEGNLEEGFNHSCFNVHFFQLLDKQIAELCALGIEADIILFHPYDRWGFSEMSKDSDNLYLNYIVARLAAYRNVWWSLANEYDLMWAKEEEDWERFATIIKSIDPYHHLISIHNCHTFYDYSRDWVTHCSIQRVDVYRTSENTDAWREQWKKPIVIDECGYEGNIDMGWGNITGEEMVRRFWEGTVRGGYIGHGETYLNKEEILWWSKGGQLIGSSPPRIAFLKSIIEAGPEEGLTPYNVEWDVSSAAIINQYYLFYYGFNQPSYRWFKMKEYITYSVDVIDTWEMTISRLPYLVSGTFKVDLPAKQYMAIRLMRVND